jgi:SAM-dependent methyltransferase
MSFVCLSGELCNPIGKRLFFAASRRTRRQIINLEITRTEVDFLERALDIDAGAQLLDVPCGNGRHAIELASRGYKMTGLDLSEEFIAGARSATPLAVRWVRDDMRSLPWVSEFDGAYCFGNSFGYLAWEEARHFLAAVARGLKPGARFVVETGMAATLVSSRAADRVFYAWNPRASRCDERCEPQTLSSTDLRAHLLTPPPCTSA